MSKWARTREPTRLTTGSNRVWLKILFFFLRLSVTTGWAHLTHGLCGFEPGYSELTHQSTYIKKNNKINYVNFNIQKTMQSLIPPFIFIFVYVRHTHSRFPSLLWFVFHCSWWWCPLVVVVRSEARWSMMVVRWCPFEGRRAVVPIRCSCSPWSFGGVVAIRWWSFSRLRQQWWPFSRLQQRWYNSL